MKVEKEVYIVKDMKAIAQNNELEFQRLLEHHPFYRQDPYVEHPLNKAYLMKDDVNDEVPMELPKL
jgi:hypothetical protein